MGRLSAPWRRAFTKIGLAGDKRRTARRNRPRQPQFEPLEERQMLAVDVVAVGFESDGDDLLVEYDIAGADATAFDIGVYRSSDGTTPDALLFSQRVSDPADLAVGSGHTATITANFTDVDEDYYLVAVLDANAEIAEDDENNNLSLFAGGAFQAVDGAVYVHGTDGANALDVSLSTTLDITLDASTTNYMAAGVPEVRIRAHGGDDTLTTGGGVSTPLAVFGGDGADAMTTGDGDDVLHGGPGDDTLDGGSGTNVFDGGAGFDEPEILDDTHAEYAETGTWGDDAAGFNGGQRTHAAGTGTEKATWTRSGLTADAYEVFVTWSEQVGAATDATFELFDDTTSLGTVSLDQTAAPTGPSVAGRPWENLGLVTLTSGTLVIELTDNANGEVLADAVRLVAHSNPTTSGIGDVDVLENAVDTVIDLAAAFNDADLPGDTLTFTVEANDNPSLVTPVVDNPSDTLTLQFGQDAFGQANLTVRATDAVGLFVETSFVVTVSDVTELQFVPGADAYIVANAGSENFGAEDELSTRWWSTSSNSPWRASFLRFPVNGLSGEVISATVRLLTLSDTTGGATNRAKEVSNDSWQEDAITRYNMPAAGADIATWTVQSGMFVEFDVTSQIQAAIDNPNDQRFSLRIDSSGDPTSGQGITTYASREHTVLAFRPVLTIEAAFDNTTAPVAAADAYFVGTAGNTLSPLSKDGVLANDTDADGNLLTAVLETSPSHADLFQLNADGSFDYKPEAGFSGVDSFTYRAADVNLTSDPVTVTIDVLPAAAIGETGELDIDVNTGGQGGGGGWETVNLLGAYLDPIVIAQPLSFNGIQQAVARIRNVTADSFEIQIDEWDYLDGNHTTETVSYLVVERGTHTLIDGTKIHADTIDADENWASYAFPQSFPAVPVTLTQTQTVNDNDAVTTRQQNVTANGLDVRLQEEQAAATPHGTETVAVVAIEAATSWHAGRRFETAVEPAVNDVGTRISWDEQYLVKPLFLAGMQTFNGADPATLRYENRTLRYIDVFVEEETSGDEETWHTQEAVGYFTFGGFGRLESGPVIRFRQLAGGADEATGQYTFEVEMFAGGLLDDDVTVDLSVVGGTADIGGGEDFTLSTNQIVFSSGTGTQVQQVTVTINEDLLIEGDEYFDLQLTNLNDPSGWISLSDAIHTGVIEDSDTGTISLDVVPGEIGELDGTYQLAVQFNSAAILDKDIALDIAALGGTATYGVDYDFAAASTVTFLTGTGTQTIYIPISIVGNDLWIEGEESADFQAILTSDPTGGQVSLGNAWHQLLIEDHDHGLIRFQSTGGTVAEGYSESVVVELVATPAGARLANPFTVTVVSGGGTASGADYSLSGVELTFNVGDGDGATRTATIDGIGGDEHEEGVETVDLVLSEGGGFALLGTGDDGVDVDPTPMQVVIIDVCPTEETASINLELCPTCTTDISGRTGGLRQPVPVGNIQIHCITDANPHPIVAVHYTIPAAVPDMIEAKLTFGGLEGETVYFSTLGLSPGDEVEIKLQADATTLATGHYKFLVQITEHHPGGALVYHGEEGYRDVVNRIDSEFGNRWSVPGLDRLVLDQDGALLVRGDSTAAWFAATGPYIFDTPDGSYSTLARHVDGTFTLSYTTGDEAFFDAGGLLTSRVDANGNTITYDYIDADGDLLADEISTITDWMGDTPCGCAGVGQTTSFAYSGGLISTVADDAGRVWTFGHAGGRLTSITHPDPDGPGGEEPPVQNFVYTAAGLLESIEDAEGNVTEFQYNFAGRVVGTVQPDAAATSLTSAEVFGLADLAAGEGTLANPAPLFKVDDVISTSVDEFGQTTVTRFDKFGYPTSRLDAAGHLYQWVRDANGRVTSEIAPDPDGPGPLASLQTDYSYDARGNLLRADFAVGTALASHVEWTYDPVFSRTTSFIDELGRVTLWEIDAGGNVVEQRRVVGQVDDVINGETDDVVIGYTYTDGAGDLPAGLLLTETDPEGVVTRYGYDDDPQSDSFTRLTSITYADGLAEEATVAFEYNALGNVTASINALGHRTEYQYDTLGRLITLTEPDPDGAGPLTSPVTSYQYDTIGNLRFLTDAEGNVTEYQYDSRGRVELVILADPDDTGPLTSPEIAYDYNTVSGHLELVTTNPLGAQTTQVFDALGRLEKLIEADPDGAGPLTSPETLFSYDAVGNLTSTIDALGNTTTYIYDQLNRLIEVHQEDPTTEGGPNGPITTYEYYADGQLKKETDPLGRATSYEYDALGRLEKITLPDADGDPGTTNDIPVYEYVYDKAGNLVQVIDPLDSITDYVYDHRNRLTNVTDAEQGTTSFAFDAAGRLTTATDALGRTTAYEYDNLNRTTKTIQPDPDGGGAELAPWTAFTYDAVGNLLTQTDRLGNQTSYGYDDLYRRTSVTDAGADTTDFAYDAVGNLVALTDPVGNTTSWLYDDLNRAIEETNELALTRYFSYDAVGNLTQKTDRNGRVTEYDYDNQYRRTAEVWKDGANTLRTLSYAFDLAGQMLTAGDPDADYTYAYDGLGRATSITHDIAGLVPVVTMAQTFDLASRRKSLSAAIGGTDDFLNDYAYDALGRMTQVTQQGQTGGNAVAEKRVNLAYNAASQWQTIARYADLAGTQLVASSNYAYDLTGRLTDLTYAKDTTTLVDYDWSFDAANRITQYVNSIDGTVDYNYDDTNQLTGADYDFQTDESYTYDENGNRTNTGYSTGDDNQLLSDGAYNYEYDDEGNRTKRTNISDSSYTEYTWDHRNRLTVVTDFNDLHEQQQQVTYAYDTFNRLVSRTLQIGQDPVVTSYFVYDGNQMTLQLDDAGNVEHRVLWGPAVDQILADENALGDVFWPLTDQQNTIRDWTVYDEVLDETSIANHITYDAFGNITSQTDNTLDTISLYYTARWYDPVTGMQWNLHRWYDPTTGRWLSPDPIGIAGQDANFYRAMRNVPTLFTDPNGLIPPSGIADVAAIPLGLGDGEPNIQVEPVDQSGSRILGTNREDQLARIEHILENIRVLQDDADIEFRRLLANHIFWIVRTIPEGHVVGVDGAGTCVGLVLTPLDHLGSALPPSPTRPVYVFHFENDTDRPATTLRRILGELNGDYQALIVGAELLGSPGMIGATLQDVLSALNNIDIARIRRNGVFIDHRGNPCLSPAQSRMPYSDE